MKMVTCEYNSDPHADFGACRNPKEVSLCYKGVRQAFISNAGSKPERKEEKVEYKCLKPITGETLYQAKACKEELKEFILLYGFYNNPEFSVLMKEAEGRPGWIEFLVNWEFIEEVRLDENEVVAQMGDTFQISGETYILAAVKQDALELINISPGRRWNDFVEGVGERLTRKEFRTLLLASASEDCEKILATKKRAEY